VTSTDSAKSLAAPTQASSDAGRSERDGLPTKPGSPRRKPNGGIPEAGEQEEARGGGTGSPTRKRLVIYLVCEPETPELAQAAVEGGADLVELGFPFSDPLAEGPTIRIASERALARGMRTATCIECLAEVRRRVETPLVPMTYAAILEAYGYDRFVADTRAAGATSSIVVDLPVEDRPDVPRIQLVAPTSTDERIAACVAGTDGWLYLVSLTGTTGARDEVSPALAGLVERTRALTDLPLYAGFGISTPEQAATVAAITDGVVVGSRAVQVAEEGPAALRKYVRSLRKAIDA
jgi:tryptophan synthase alpha chain